MWRHLFYNSVHENLTQCTRSRRTQQHFLFLTWETRVFPLRYRTESHSRIRYEDQAMTGSGTEISCVTAEDAAACIDWRRRRRQGDEGPPRGRRTLTGREASQEDYRKQIISVEIPLANSLGTLPRRGISGSKLPAKLQARTEVVEARRSALQDLLWQQPSDIVDKIIEGSNIVRCKIDLDELCRAMSQNRICFGGRFYETYTRSLMQSHLVVIILMINTVLIINAVNLTVLIIETVIIK